MTRPTLHLPVRNLCGPKLTPYVAKARRLMAEARTADVEAQAFLVALAKTYAKKARQERRSAAFVLAAQKSEKPEVPSAKRGAPRLEMWA